MKGTNWSNWGRQKRRKKKRREETVVVVFVSSTSSVAGLGEKGGVGVVILCV